MRWITFAASGLGAIGLFAGRAGAVPTVVLEPIPWATSGIGMHSIFTNADLEIRVDVCGDSGCEDFEFQFAAMDPIAFHQHGAQFDARLVSRIDGNLWEYGFEDIQMVLDEDVRSLSVSASVFATFTVPFDGIHGTSSIAYDSNEPFFQDDTTSGIDWIETRIAGDTVKLRYSVGWSIQPTETGFETFNGCTFDPQPGIVLDDCLHSVEIFSPTVADGLRHPGVAEPGSALLVGAGAALGIGARRRRRYAA